jgi:hypothetical protein
MATTFIAPDVCGENLDCAAVFGLFWIFWGGLWTVLGMIAGRSIEERM